MMRTTLKSTLVAFALIAGLFLAALPVSAHPVTSSAAPARPTVFPGVTGFTGKSCHTLHVTLRGTLPAIAQCLDARATTGGNIAPRTVSENCGNVNDLQIWQDAGRGSASICFTGNGFANMTMFIINPFVNWNDQASSYAAGVWYGKFYSDINGGGIKQNYSKGQTGNFTGNPLPNDSLSSVCLDSSSSSNCP